MTGSPAYEWPEGKRSAACFSVDVDAESPYLWQNREAMPPVLGQLEARRFGMREGLWRILDLVESLGIRGSFYVPGIVAEMHPQVLPALVERGHEVGLHGWLHEIVSESDDDAFRRALDRSLALFEQQVGLRPRGFRSPAWEMTPGMVAGLKEQGLSYDSSLMGFDHPYEVDGLTEVPVQWLIDDAIYFKFAGGGADRWPPQPVRAVEESWREEWQVGRDFGALFMMTVHDWISGRAQRIGMLSRLLEEIVAQGDVWVATVGEIADWHASSANAGRHAVSSTLPEVTP